MKQPRSLDPTPTVRVAVSHFPIFLRLDGRSCLVVGGGEIASRKARSLLGAGADVCAVAPEFCADLERLGEEGRLRLRCSRYDSTDLDGAHIVIAATDDREVNARVSSEAQARRIPVNVVDDPDLCSFIVPAILDRSPVVVAVSTGGASPALARLLRTRLGAALPGGAGPLAEMLAAARQRVRDLIPEASDRAAFWERALAGEIAGLGLSGRIDEARRLLDTLIVGLRR